MRKFIVILLLVVPSSLFALDIMQGFTTIPWKGQAPILKDFGQLTLPHEHEAAPFIYRVLTSPYGIEWLESYVDGKIRKQFSLAYGNFLNSTLPFEKVHMAFASRDGYPLPVKIIAHGANGTIYEFEIVIALDDTGTFVVVALGNVPLEGSKIEVNKSP